jgi:hypothetical protein
MIDIQCERLELPRLDFTECGKSKSENVQEGIVITQMDIRSGYYKKYK